MPAKIPQREPFREKDLRQLENIYKRAGRNIMATFDAQTDFEQFRRAGIMRQIEQILADAGVETGQWLDTVLPDTYQRGTGDVLKQLATINAPIKAATAFGTIDQRAVQVLISETQEAFATALTTVGRTAGQLLSQAVKDQITLELAEGTLTGATRRAISDRVKAALKAGGVTGLVDKRGAKWELDRYAAMLARTKLMEARNTGVANKMLENGYDLVEITGGNSTHSACAKWEYKIVSLSGKSTEYPSLADAKADGIFHPNCQHHYNIVHSSLAAMTKAYNPNTGLYERPSWGQPRAGIPSPAGGRQTTKKIAPGVSRVKNASSNTLVVPGPKGKTSQTFKLSPLEARVIAENNIVPTSKPPRSRWAPNTLGVYSERPVRDATGAIASVTRQLHIRPGAVGTRVKHTVYHEIGHAIDAMNVHANGYQSGQKLNKRPDVFAALQADRTSIVALRLKRDLGDDYSDEDLKLVAQGRTVRRTDEHGRTRVLSLGKWGTYARSDSEVFADAYGAWRLDPTGLKKVAPNLAKVFEELL